MKIALLGYGKMGKLVEHIALKQGHKIILQHHSQSELQPHALKADIAIDFSQAEAVIPHLEWCLKQGIPLLIGTTGWEYSLPAAKKRVKESNGCCLYSPNFSIGIYLFQQILSSAASLFQSFKEYDVAGIESHHQEKKDLPSGTAKKLTQQIKDLMPRLGSFAFNSVRCGHMPGTHTLIFDSPIDTITLSHEARNREGFAQGALLAAEWLLGKKGFFTFEEFIQNQLTGVNNET